MVRVRVRVKHAVGGNLRLIIGIGVRLRVKAGVRVRSQG